MSKPTAERTPTTFETLPDRPFFRRILPEASTTRRCSIFWFLTKKANSQTSCWSTGHRTTSRQEAHSNPVRKGRDRGSALEACRNSSAHCEPTLHLGLGNVSARLPQRFCHATKR